MSEYRFERITESHYDDLIYISKSAFGINPGRNFYKLKNDTGKFGETHLGFMAYHKLSNEPSAFYGVYSYPFEFNNKIYCAAQSGDTMTHRNHAGKGLFTTLARMTYDLAKEKGVEFIFGFPNDNSYPGFVKKLNWVHTENLLRYDINLFTIPLLKLSKKIKLLKLLYDPYFNYIIRNKITLETFESSAKSENAGVVFRSKDFYKYKSFTGNKIITIDDVKVWLKADGSLWIGDIEKKENLNFKSFERKLKRLCFWLGADKIVFQMSPGVFWDKLLSSYYESKKTLAIGYLNLSGKLPVEHFKYMFGDSDTF